jgi:4-diphosphocytidyl-2-C-methyl-D-erythritol kinase
MSRVARVPAQAKINLLLRVLAREQSGFHSLETVFLRLTLSDDVAVRAGEGIRGRSIDCRGELIAREALGPAERNLAYRAAVAYADATGWPAAFAIEIDKRIPVGGGLGGGSADAGAVLRALDAMAPVPLGDRLPELAIDLGADVPFLSLDSPMALGWGRGERLFPLPVLSPRPVVLVMPSFGVSTREAFEWLAHDRGGDAYVPRTAVLRPADVDTWDGIARTAVNEFEPVVARHHPEIGRCVDALRVAGARLAMMSGSGSTVFGVFDGDSHARGALAAMTSGSGRPTVTVTQTADRVQRVEID